MEKLENSELEYVNGGTGETYKIGDKYSYHCNNCGKDVVGTIFGVGAGYFVVSCSSCFAIQQINF